MPVLELLLPLYGFPNPVEFLAPDKHLQIILLRKTWYQPRLVFRDSSFEIVGYTNLQRAVLLVCQNVNIHSGFIDPESSSG